MKNNTKLKTILTFIFALITSSLFGQSLSIQNLSIDDNNQVSLECSIQKKHTDRERYELLIFSSVDNFNNPIGYTFPNMKPGKIYEVSFDGNKEVEGFTEETQFRFKANPTAIPVVINSEDGRTLRKEKRFELKWKDYHNIGVLSGRITRRGITGPGAGRKELRNILLR